MNQFIDPNDLQYSKKFGFAKSGIEIENTGMDLV